mgnify:FL=1
MDIDLLLETAATGSAGGAGTFVSAKLGLTEDPLGLSLVCDKRKMVRNLLQVRLMIEPRMASMAVS